MEKLIIFDLDGTLAQSKSHIDAEMTILLTKLLQFSKVAVISGGSWHQFETQLLANLPNDCNLQNLSLLPVCGTQFYRFTEKWKLLYSEDLTTQEKNLIINTLNNEAKKNNLTQNVGWGPLIEDRGSQITFSGLGQSAPLSEKLKWDPDFEKRKKIKNRIDEVLSAFSIRLGGTTSIDITKKGVDKAYAVAKLNDILKIHVSEMVFIGDAIFPEGNDFPVLKTGIKTISVKNSNETKNIIKRILNSF